MNTNTETKTLELLEKLKDYFLNCGDIIEQNGIKKPDDKLNLYIDIRDLLDEIQKNPKKVKI